MDIATKLTQIAEKEAENIELNNQLEQTLYGTDTGGKSYYDLFWDSYQQNGNRTAYYQAFSGDAWTSITCKPKYDIKPITCGRIFTNSKFTDGNITDYFNELGIELDFSNCTSPSEMLTGSTITGIGIVDMRKGTANYLFGGAKNLKEVRLLIIKDNGTTNFNTQSFQHCEALEDITIQGVIGKGITFQWSPKLTKDSIASIITHLSDNVGATLTLSATAVNKAFETEEGLLDGEFSEVWLNLKADKSNWTIALV